jgi:Glycosyl transferases group 1
VLTYDGYLSSSRPVDAWLHQLLYGRSKQTFTIPFYTSCPQTPYQAPTLNHPHLVYLGTNWDGPRFQPLFEALDSQGFMAVYGQETAWAYLQNSYRGTLPFDGVSVLNALQQAGVGLCLHAPPHRAAAVPSMRIFEIVAAGAIALCEPHPFITEHFADTVLYIDADRPPLEKAHQITQQLEWIRHHPQQALAMSQAAHRIFSERFTLEHLLRSILPHHTALMPQKGFIATDWESGTHRFSPLLVECPLVEVIIRVPDLNFAGLQRTLLSLVSQTYPAIAAIIVPHPALIGLADWLEPYQTKLNLKIIASPSTEFSSTGLWQGLHAITADYFAILKAGEVLYPNHVHTLMALLRPTSAPGVAYSGAICRTELRVADAPSAGDEPATIGYFAPFDLDQMMRFATCLAMPSFIARTALLNEEIRPDPQLTMAEDLFLLLHLCRQTPFVFSYETTCEYSSQGCPDDNVTLFNPDSGSSWVKSLQYLLAGKEFPARQIAPLPPFNANRLAPLTPLPEVLSAELADVRQQLHQAHQQLHQAHLTIAAMQTSKFWQIRRFWFKLKRVMGLVKADQIVP